MTLGAPESPTTGIGCSALALAAGMETFGEDAAVARSFLFCTTVRWADYSRMTRRACRTPAGLPARRWRTSA